MYKDGNFIANGDLSNTINLNGKQKNMFGGEELLLWGCYSVSG